MKTTLWTLALMTLACASGLGQSDALAITPTAPPGYVTAAIADPARPPEDTARDADRKPAELIEFAGIKPGDRIADLMPGGGYFTRIFSKVVGPTGKVYAIVPEFLAKVFPKAVDNMKQLTAGTAYANVTMLIEPLDQTGAPEKLDLVWTSQNYHDVYGQAGADAAEATDKAIFRALKPGGGLSRHRPRRRRWRRRDRLDDAAPHREENGRTAGAGRRLRARRREHAAKQPRRPPHRQGLRPGDPRTHRSIRAEIQEAEGVMMMKDTRNNLDGVTPMPPASYRAQPTVLATELHRSNREAEAALDRALASAARTRAQLDG